MNAQTRAWRGSGTRHQLDVDPVVQQVTGKLQGGRLGASAPQLHVFADQSNPHRW
jgi:hypothetical protein